MGDGPVLLCGLGKVGWRVLDALRAAGLPVAVVDLHASADDPRLAGLPYVRGDIRSPQILHAAGITTAGGVVIVTSDDLANVAAALLARRLNPDCRVVVRMFNQSLIPRLGTAVRNTTALSVSALTAPLLVLSALTGEALAAFKVGDVPQQVAELTVREGDPLAGLSVAAVANRRRLLVLAHTPAGGPAAVLRDVSPDAVLAPGDRLVVCGRPQELEPVLLGADALGGVRWAGRVRRFLRTARRSVGLIDWPVRAGGAVLFVTLLVSTLVFRYGLGTGWADGFYQTVSVVATGADLHGDKRDGPAKVFLGGLKLLGAALLAGVTALLTQYLIRAKLGGALEAGRIPDGGHVVVCGLGNVGFRCVEELVRMGRPVVAVEKVADNPFAATVRRMGVPVVIGDATVPEVLRQARAADARAVIAATSSELANLEVGLLVREARPGQRVVVRLGDADFAAAVREAADIRHAVSVPALAAPAFVAALLGDRVQALASAGGRTLAVIELAIDADDPHLCGRLLTAVAADRRFVPIGLAGLEPLALNRSPQRILGVGDRLTVVVSLDGLGQLLQRSPAVVAQGVHSPAQPPNASAAPRDQEFAMSDTVDSIKDAAKNAADKAKDLAQKGADKASDAAEDAGDAAKDATRDAGKAVERTGRDLKDEGK